ncbi:MAG: V-type ATP synthase subunit F [Patescibacteria group bacterium UBA2163]
MSTNTQQTMRVAAIGPRELLGGLQLFGAQVYHSNTPEDAFNALHAIHTSKESYAIVFIVESIVSNMTDAQYEEATSRDLPVVLTIPDLTSPEDAGLDKLRLLTKRAVGVDIFKD